MTNAREHGLSPGLFRLILAGLVVFDHFSGVMLGRGAVFVFFVLSGFWISRMWRERYAELRSPYVTFVISRLWRLLPTMLVATVFAATLFMLAGGLDSLSSDGIEWGHLTFSSIFLIGYAELASPRLVEPAWSLDIEMRFYIIAPLLIVALRALGAVRFLGTALAIFAITALGLVSDTPIAVLGLKYLGWFAIGMAAEHVRWSPPQWASTASLGGFVAIIAAALVVFPAILTDPALNQANLQLNWLLAFVAAPYAIATCYGASTKRDREFGDISYTVYLIHWPVFAVLFVTEAISPVTIAASLIAIGAVSWAILRFVDQPLQKARTRWVASRSVERVYSPGSA